MLNSEKESESLHKRWRDKILHYMLHLSVVYELIRLRTEFQNSVLCLSEPLVKAMYSDVI